MHGHHSATRIALIFPYFRTHAATELLFPPLGAATLASQLQRLGLEWRIFDCTFRTFDDVLTELKEWQPDVAGIYSMITLSRSAFRLAGALRAYLPGVVLVAGGPLPTLYPAQYSTVFDVVFRGESDLSFPRFCRDLAQIDASRERLHELPLGEYDGLVYRGGDQSWDNQAVHYPEKDLEGFPIPARDGFDHAAYQRTWSAKDGSRTTSLITTLGCSFTCDFCSKPIFGNLFRRRNLDLVFEEIGEIRRYGYDRLWIADDNFTLDSRYLADFCRRISDSGMRWSCLSRVTGITQEVVRAMKSAGCTRVYLGLESGDPATLKLMNKQASLEEGERAVRLFHETGVEVAAFFIVGYPGESTASIESTFRWALQLPLHYLSFNVPFPLPGSPLFERVGTVDSARDWDEENEVAFVYESEFDESWLKRRIGETMRAFAERQAS